MAWRRREYWFCSSWPIVCAYAESLNSAYAQTMGQLLQNQYSRLRQAIQERF